MLSPFLQFGLSCLSFHIYFCFSQNYFKYFLVLQFHLFPKISPLICRFFLFAFNMKHQNYSASKFRSSHPEFLSKKGIFRNFTKFTRKHPCQRLFFKVAGLRAIFVAFSLISLLLVSKNFFRSCHVTRYISSVFYNKLYLDLNTFLNTFGPSYQNYFY